MANRSGYRNASARRSRALLPVLLWMTACAGSPEEVTYEREDFRARWIDRFNVDKRACERAGGVIVRERHTPDSIRIGAGAPEAGTRYGCAR